MKTKRLRALLVAGLLSLAPAVTLTSCGGGGGGGGGNNDDGDIVAPDDDGDETLSDIVGKTVIIEMSTGTQLLTFGEHGVAEAKWTYTSGGGSVESKGKYGITSYSNAAYAEVSITFPAVETWRLYYLVENGKLKASYATLETNGKTQTLTNCRFQ